ncbi:MAG: GrpB family protein [Tannerellaceae bacterium]|nr:GrpB family protein [Tannerellaceae bacterium]
MDKKSLNNMTNSELWKLFPIILSKYKSDWPDRYAEEKELLVQTIDQNNIVRINHIGSTAVTELIAKPTIDILLEIYSHTDITRLINGLQTAGYIYSPQPDNLPPHMMFLKGYTPEGFKGQAYHVHIRYRGDWDELYFRDYLIVSPETAKEYGKLKLKLKSEFTYNRDAYTSAKTDFIKHITSLARLKFPERYK